MAARTREVVRPSSGRPTRVGGRGAGGDLLEAEEDHGDVVAPAGLVGRGHQGPGGLLHGGRLTQHGGDLAVLDHGGQPVAAQEEHVAGLGRPCGRVDLHGGLGAQGAGDDGALRVVVGLLGGELALALELLDQRVVVGEALEGAVAQPVGARVADMGHGDIVLADHRGGDRGAHALAGAVGLGQVVDALIGQADPRAQGSLGVLVAFVVEPRLEGLHGQPRGDLAGLGAAHPVGDYEQRSAGEA
jgi:hypothetical protein